MSTTDGWTHKTVYQALIERGERTKKSRLNRYVVLYEQEGNAALLYEPGCANNARPLHLLPGSKSWRPEVYTRIRPAILSVHLEKGGEGQQSNLHCKVKDWSRLAKALALKFPKITD